MQNQTSQGTRKCERRRARPAWRYSMYTEKRTTDFFLWAMVRYHTWDRNHISWWVGSQGDGEGGKADHFQRYLCLTQRKAKDGNWRAWHKIRVNFLVRGGLSIFLKKGGGEELVEHRDKHQCKQTTDRHSLSHVPGSRKNKRSNVKNVSGIVRSANKWD